MCVPEIFQHTHQSLVMSTFLSILISELGNHVWLPERDINSNFMSQIKIWKFCLNWKMSHVISKWPIKGGFSNPLAGFSYTLQKIREQVMTENISCMNPRYAKYIYKHNIEDTWSNIKKSVLFWNFLLFLVINFVIKSKTM